MSVNKVIIVGNLGADPEKKVTGSGSTVTTFNVATTNKWKDKSGQLQEKTEWHKVEVWGGQAEACANYLAKGRQVYVEGRIQTDQWDDKDGNKKRFTKIVASQVMFLGSKAQSSTTTTTSTPQPDFDTNPGFDTGSDVPF
ncbi:MAG: single-stranded DNA-binding protein [Pseudomonadota bacterium]